MMDIRYLPWFNYHCTPTTKQKPTAISTVSSLIVPLLPIQSHDKESSPPPAYRGPNTGVIEEGAGVEHIVCDRGE